MVTIVIKPVITSPGWGELPHTANAACGSDLSSEKAHRSLWKVQTNSAQELERQTSLPMKSCNYSQLSGLKTR
jgi:hypothetical protein